MSAHNWSSFTFFWYLLGLVLPPAESWRFPVISWSPYPYRDERQYI